MQLSVVGGSSLQQHERDCAEGTTLEGQSSSAELLLAQVGAVTHLPAGYIFSHSVASHALLQEITPYLTFYHDV